MMAPPPRKRCKDCAPDAPYRTPSSPGPRCATHWREELKRRKAAMHRASVNRTYGLRDDDYGRLYEGQGGVCALCQRANGATRRLGVDHDHRTGEVRGLLCRPCNTLLGHARDDIAFFARCIRYLSTPPAREILQ